MRSTSSADFLDKCQAGRCPPDTAAHCRNSCADLFMLGDPADVEWRKLDLATLGVSASLNGRLTAPATAQCSRQPLIALTRLANELSGLGIALRRGQVVTTGTCMIPVEVRPEDVVSVASASSEI